MVTTKILALRLFFNSGENHRTLNWRSQPLLSVQVRSFGVAKNLPILFYSLTNIFINKRMLIVLGSEWQDSLLIFSRAAGVDLFTVEMRERNHLRQGKHCWLCFHSGLFFWMFIKIKTGLCDSIVLGTKSALSFEFETTKSKALTGRKS